MRICFLGDAGHVNLLSLTRVLIERLSHEVHVLTFNAPCEAVDGLFVHVLGSRVGREKLRYPFAIWAVRRIVGAIRPDVLIGYRLTSYGFLAAMSGYRPMVAVAQGSDLFHPSDPLLPRQVARFVIRRADLLQVWAPHMTKRLIELGADPSRILTLPKGIDTGVFTPGDERDDGPPTLVSTRQLRREYNHQRVLQVVGLLAESLPTLQYVICGSGEFREPLVAQAAALNVSARVRFVGRVPHEDLPRYLRPAQVYISLQPSDGVSASLLEAMACGTFPIVSDNEANRAWIVDGVNGFLVPPDDIVAIADRVTAAFADHELRLKARAANLEIVAQRASIVGNVATMCDWYARLGPRR